MKTQDCIFFQLAKAYQSGIRFWKDKLAAFNITAVQSQVLAFLGEEDRISSTTLGQRIQLDSATLTGILDRLVTAGLVERKQHPDDRRAILVCLTEKGRQTAQRLRSRLEDANREFLNTLGEDEQVAFRGMLGKLRN